MLRRSTVRHVALAICTLLLAGLLVVVPVNPFAPPPVANAVVAVSDIVYRSGGNTSPGLYLRKASDGTSTLLLAGADLQYPSISPDGSRIAFAGIPSPYTEWGIYAMNSDGSGVTKIVGIDPCEDYLDGCTGSQRFGYAFYGLEWSRNGQSIAYTKYSNATGIWRLKTINIGTGVQLNVRTSTTRSFYRVAWSPDNNRIAYDGYEGGQSQIRIINADGTGDHLITSTVGVYNDASPSWSPDGSRIYVESNESNGISYFSSTNGFTTATATRSTLTTEGVGGKFDPTPHPNGDGSIIYFSTNGHGSTSGDASNLAKISSSGGAITLLTSTSTDAALSDPSSVNAAYPAAPPSNSMATFSTPSSSDAPYTRQVTVNLSSTGIQRFELGWSNSATTAPNASYVQTITNMTTKKGAINFLGKYSGTDTNWNGGTQPDQDWYLWVRSVKTNGTINTWNTSPLKVHTPRRPVWVAVGDSYSSGHHQDADELTCPTPEDTPIYLDVWETGCLLSGAPHLTTNDLNYSWVKKAVDSYNTSLHAPTDPVTGWSYGLDLVAYSGASTASFGTYNVTPGTDAWASGTTQSYSIRKDLYTRYDSWNIVSMTGGANDTNWVTELSNYYHGHFGIGATAPWAVSGTNPAVDCPNSQSVYAWLKAAQLDGQTLDAHIRANLQGIVTVTNRFSPSTRILNVGYPYVLNSGNVCLADSGTWHGSKSVTDDLNANHTAITGTNVHYINLATAFGVNPLTYIQLRRLYGYPHPVDTGQTLIATTVVSNLTAGW